MFSIPSNSRVKSWKKKKRKDPQRITKIKPFINKYNWEGINFPSQKHDWKKFEKNNVTIALNVLYAIKEKNIFSLCFKTYLKSWKTNYSFLTIPNEEKWHYFAIKKHY